MFVLILDDDESRIKQFRKNNIPVVVNWYTDPYKAIEELQQNITKYDLICLDHDLGIITENGEVTAMPVVDYLRHNYGEKYNDKQAIIVHSLNRPAAVAMMQTLQHINCKIYMIPFAWSKENLFKSLMGT